MPAIPGKICLIFLLKLFSMPQCTWNAVVDKATATVRRLMLQSISACNSLCMTLFTCTCCPQWADACVSCQCHWESCIWYDCHRYWSASRDLLDLYGYCPTVTRRYVPAHTIRDLSRRRRKKKITIVSFGQPTSMILIDRSWQSLSNPAKCHSFRST